MTTTAAEKEGEEGVGARWKLQRPLERLLPQDQREALLRRLK
jgi:hypothetical protein